MNEAKTYAAALAAYIRENKQSIAREFCDHLLCEQPDFYGRDGCYKADEASGSALDLMLVCLDEKTLRPLEEYFRVKAQVKIEHGVAVRDVVVGFLQGKRSVANSIRNSSMNAEDKLDMLQALDLFYTNVIATTTEMYTTFMVEKIHFQHAHNSLLLEASKTISSALDPDEALNKLAQVLGETVEQGYCTIFLHNKETGGLSPKAMWRYTDSTCQAAFQSLRLCTQGDAIEGVDGTTFGLCSATIDSKRLHESLPQALRSQNMILFPIANGEKQLGAAIVGSAREDYVFDDSVKELIGGILNAVAVTIESAASARETRKRLQESESLRRVADTLLQCPVTQRDDVLTLICDETRLSVQCEACSILLEEGEQFHQARATGAFAPLPEYTPASAGWINTVSRKDGCHWVHDAPSQMGRHECHEDLKTMLAVPLIEQDRRVGFLVVANKAGGFDLEDKRIMEMFGATTVMALRNARMAQQSEKLAVGDERQRLARELHDSVTQALYAVTLCADAAKRSLVAGKQDAALEQLGALSSMSQQAMRDMRSLIFDLHPPELEHEGLAGALQARLNAVEVRSGLSADLRVDGDERRLPLTVEEELFRIGIEALNNATKHSSAHKVDVALVFEPESVTLGIEDDGKGFDMKSLPAGGIGLRGMGERAQRIGAELGIDSVVGSGTHVTVRVPITE